MMLLSVCLSCISSILLVAKADTSVHILSKKYGNDGQLITSSILNWIPESQYSASKYIVIGGYEKPTTTTGEATDIKKVIFVCRAMHSGIWVAGGRREDENKCTVSLAGSVGSYQSYQLLENVESAARVSWYNWTKYEPKPVGTVGTGGTDKYFVARYVAAEQADHKPAQSHYIGTLSTENSLGIISFVKENGEEGSAEEGQLLVETEPIAYQLNNVVLNHMKERVEKQEERILGEATLANRGSSPADMAEAISYSYQYLDYWGQGHVMFRGLNTSVTLENRTRLPNINWGLEIKETRTSLYTIQVRLEPGTGVNVSLQGVQAIVEVPYSAQLFSHYEDKASVSPRKISGYRREELMRDIRPVFGAPYFLGNLSLVPTSGPPTAAPGSAASVESTTSGRANSQMAHQMQETSRTERTRNAAEDGSSGSSDENSILPKRPEATGMQGDDGGPLSLKNNVEGSRNAATRDTSSITIVLAFTVALVAQRSFPLLFPRVT